MTDIDTATVLSPQQETVMLAMLMGQPQKRAAQIAGVREETVSRWINDDEGAFIQVYAARRADVWRAYEGRIGEMVNVALGHLEALMRGPDYAGSDYDARTRLLAVQTTLTMAGLLRTGTRVFAPNSQVNLADKQVNISEGN